MRARGTDNLQGLDEALILNRIALAFRAFWRVLTDLDFAARVEPLFSKAPTGPDLRVLAVLQRDGRLVDFLEEEIDGYSDAQVGAAVRDIHRSAASRCTITSRSRRSSRPARKSA